MTNDQYPPPLPAHGQIVKKTAHAACKRIRVTVSTLREAAWADIELPR